MDSGSTDETPHVARRLGARVIFQSSLRFPGRGVSMRDGFYLSTGEVIVYISTDASDIDEEFIENLYTPILSGEADLVKYSFSVKSSSFTENTIRSLLERFYPGLAKISQLAAREFAGLRKALQVVEWEFGWGSEIGVLLDVYRAGMRIMEIKYRSRDREIKRHELPDEALLEIIEIIVKRALRDHLINQSDADTLLAEYKKLISKERKE